MTGPTQATTRPPYPAARPTPAAVRVLGLVALATIVAPVAALGTRVPWGRIGTILAAEETAQLLRVTVASSLLSCLITVLIGAPLALWMRNLRRGAQLARLLVLVPLALPPVVAGLALTALIGRRGLAAPVLDLLGVQFAFAFPGVVASHVFVALPFVVITLDSALRQLDGEVLDSAAGVGISPSRATLRITLPAVAPALVSAAGLACARSLGEFGTTLTFAGSLPGVTRTMPLGIYIAREIDQPLAYGLAAVLTGLAVATLALTLLPSALSGRGPAPRPRVTGSIDAAALEHLCRPAADGPEVSVGGATFPAGATTALIGPNGSGKTTLLGQIAGRLTGPEVRIAGRRVDGLPAHRRGVVMLTQTPGLPPTSTPLKAVAMVTGEVSAARSLLHAAGLAELADVPVRALSGGQAAQVALVRALAARPRVLLLDEPLAAIDVDSARRWRHILRATASGRTAIVVTHNPLDIAALSQHTAVMERGDVAALRPTGDELRAPSTAFSARLAGRNLLPATLTSGARPGQPGVARTPCGPLRATAAAACGAGQPVVAVFSPADARLTDPASGDLRARVLSLTPTASGGVDIELDAGDGVLVCPTGRDEALALEPGAWVGVHVPTGAALTYAPRALRR